MFKNDLYKLDLQFFADEEVTEEETTGDSVDEPNKVELTEEELQKRVESESDRKVAKALDRYKKEMRAELEKEVKEQREEAERLAKLSAKEREEAEFKKRQEALDKREQELAEKELKAQAITELHEKRLPSNFADFLIASDADKTFENINNFKTAFDTAVEDTVTERLKGDPPKTGTTKTGMTKDQFNAMSYGEKAKLYKEQPDIYQKLSE